MPIPINGKMMKFRDIEQFPFAGYRVNIAWSYLEGWIANQQGESFKLDMSPMYQRGYIWTREQKIAYIEYQLRGGFSGRDIFWNCPTWMRFNKHMNIIELVDGKQRIQAVLDFLHNKIPAFGVLLKDYKDKLPSMEPSFIFHVNNLKTQVDVVKWYLGMNTGGSIHTEQDLKPAKTYLKKLERQINERSI